MSFTNSPYFYHAADLSRERPDRLLKIIEQSKSGKELIDSLGGRQGAEFPKISFYRTEEKIKAEPMYSRPEGVMLNPWHRDHDAVTDLVHELVHARQDRGENALIIKRQDGHWETRTQFVERVLNSEAEAQATACKITYELCEDGKREPFDRILHGSYREMAATYYHVMKNDQTYKSLLGFYRREVSREDIAFAEAKMNWRDGERELKYTERAERYYKEGTRIQHDQGVDGQKTTEQNPETEQEEFGHATLPERPWQITVQNVYHLNEHGEMEVGPSPYHLSFGLTVYEKDGEAVIVVSDLDLMLSIEGERDALFQAVIKGVRLDPDHVSWVEHFPTRTLENGTTTQEQFVHVYTESGLETLANLMLPDGTSPPIKPSIKTEVYTKQELLESVGHSEFEIPQHKALDETALNHIDKLNEELHRIEHNLSHRNRL